MNIKEFKKQMYVCPTIKIVKTDLEYQLLTGSNMSGGHNSGTIAPPVSNAKQVFFEDEAEEEDEDKEDYNNSWGI